jgi:hypothetical protein
MSSPPSLYICLFHGRTDPDMHMDDWGSIGPAIGPFDSVHSTYSSNLRGVLEDAGEELWLRYYGDMIAFNNVLYGDFAISTDPRGHEIIWPEKAFALAEESERWVKKLEVLEGERRLRRARMKELPEIERTLNEVIELATSFTKLDGPNDGFPGNHEDLLELARAMCAAVLPE